MTAIQMIKNQWQSLSFKIFKFYPAWLSRHTIGITSSALGALSSGWKTEKRRTAPSSIIEVYGTVPIVAEVAGAQHSEESLARLLASLSRHCAENNLLGSSVFLLSDNDEQWNERIVAICNSQVLPVDVQLFRGESAFKKTLDASFPKGWEKELTEISAGIRIPTGMNLPPARLNIHQQDRNTAREFLKQSGLHLRFVCVSSTDADNDYLSAFIDFCALNAPHIKFINVGLIPINCDAQISAHNMIECSEVGLDIFDRLARALESDAFVGCADLFAFAAEADGKPIFISSSFSSERKEWVKSEEFKSVDDFYDEIAAILPAYQSLSDPQEA